VSAPSSTTPPDPLEELLADAMAALDAGGQDGLERFLAEHATEAPALREALAGLRGFDAMAAAAPAALPQRFGEFRLLAPLGSGGMGVVYLAEQQSLGREVALKVVRPELLLFEGSRERFRREIEAVARLEHPAIVPILATGADDGVPWYAMPRLRGRSGEAVLRALADADPHTLQGDDLRRTVGVDADGPTDTGGAFLGTWWQSVVRLVRQAALGIQHAHERGVLHRDLKPSNLMLTSDGRAIVLDFGLALARGDARLTRSGAVAGSPAYMAPEQLRSEPADERTDVYGLGATAWCLLGLRPPFPLADGEVMRQRILHGQRQPLRERVTVPPELELVLACAMEVERNRRYPSAQAFADDLQAVLDGRSIVARALPLSVRARRFAQRHRGLAATAATSLLFALLLPLLLWWQQRAANAELAANNVELQRQVARADRSVAQSLDAIETLLGRVAVERLRFVPAAQRNAEELLAAALQQCEAFVADERHGERARLLRLRCTVDMAALTSGPGTRERLDELALRALAWIGSGDVPPPLRHLRIRVRLLQAWSRFRSGDLAAVPPLLATAHTDLKAHDAAAPGALVREHAIALELEAGLAQRRGDMPAAEQATRRRVLVLAASPTVDATTLASARVTLAGLLRERGATVEARALVDEAIPVAQSRVDAPETGWPVPRYVLACALHQRASLARVTRTDGTERDARDALRLLDALVRDYPEEPAVRRQRGMTANLLTLLLHDEQRWAESRALMEQACADQRFVLSLDAGDTFAQTQLGFHLMSLAVDLRELGDWPALAKVARELATFGGANHVGRAARDLLRCAAAMPEEQHAALHTEVLDLLAAAQKQGLRITATDPLYAPLRDDPRFQALLGR
jgi:hypothetical protein